MAITRGEVWLTNFDPSFRTELHKNRPALIISSNEVNKHHPRVIVIPISTKNYSGLSVVAISSKRSGLDKVSFVLAAEIRAIDKDRLIRKIGKISKSKMTEVEEAIKLVLDMEEN